MIFQEFYNTKSNRRNHLDKGMILVDVILAMTLSIIFVVFITKSSLDARDIFESAKERNRLIELYKSNADRFENMMPYEYRTIVIKNNNFNIPTTTINAYAKWYGNDQVQTEIKISTNNITDSFITKRDQSVIFEDIHAYSQPDTDKLTSIPFCSVDFSNKDTIGSYKFLQNDRIRSQFLSQLDPRSLDLDIISMALPFNTPLPLTDFQIRSKRAYISTNSSKQLDPDILIFDINDNSNIDLISSINTGPGIASIALVGNKIFAAVTSRTYQLQIINMPTINNITIESSYKLPLPYATATPALGSAIFYDNNLIYLGTEKWDGEEFNIVDVSDQIRPRHIGGLEIGSKIGNIFVRNNIAYITASDQKELNVIDISDPTNPILLSSFGSSGWERQEGKVISFFEDTLKFGRTSGGFNIKQDHELFDWGTSSIKNIDETNSASTSNLYLLDPYLFYTPIPNSSDIPGGVYGIIVDRSFVYIITRQNGHEFQILDHNLSSTTIKNIPLPVIPQKITCDNDSLYILGATSPVIYQILLK